MYLTGLYFYGEIGERGRGKKKGRKGKGVGRGNEVEGGIWPRPTQKFWPAPPMHNEYQLENRMHGHLYTTIGLHLLMKCKYHHRFHLRGKYTLHTRR